METNSQALVRPRNPHSVAVRLLAVVVVEGLEPNQLLLRRRLVHHQVDLEHQQQAPLASNPPHQRLEVGPLLEVQHLLQDLVHPHQGSAQHRQVRLVARRPLRHSEVVDLGLLPVPLVVLERVAQQEDLGRAARQVGLGAPLARLEPVDRVTLDLEHRLLLFQAHKLWEQHR